MNTPDRALANPDAGTDDPSDRDKTDGPDRGDGTPTVVDDRHNAIVGGRQGGRQPRGWVQHLIIVTILIVVTVGAAAAIRTLAAVTRDSSTGAAPSSAYHEALSAGFPLEGRIRWRANVDGLRRNPTEATLDRIATDWAAIWFTIDGLHSDQPIADPRILIGDSVLTRIREHRPPVTWQTVAQSEHELQVNYYSLDGALVGLNVDATARHRFADSVTDAPLEYSQASSYHAVLLLTDGRWRLISLERV